MIFGSVNIYSLSVQLGGDDAPHEFRRQVNEPDPDCLPAARTMHRLRQVDELALALDAAGTSIGKNRSRFLHAFYSMPDADVWVSCDDDVEASFETLRWLVEAVRDTRGVCIAPCLLRRKQPVVNIMFESAGILRPLSNGGHAVRCLAGGFGLVAVHRDVATRIYAEREDLAWLDDVDGLEKRAAFIETYDAIDRKWWGEDLSFCLATVPKDVRIECLVSGHTVHDGKLLDLSQVPSQARLSLPSGASLTANGQVDCPHCGQKGRIPTLIPPTCQHCGKRLDEPPTRSDLPRALQGDAP
ncbi:MAG TPA: hypothetical protein VL131_05915 [Gammaproteobacteria bacterium]|nr:hypothetical protein [Gammaproteobacteria bacterium]